jgi:hypothetical protein
VNTLQYIKLDMKSTAYLAKQFPDIGNQIADERLCQYAKMAMEEKLEEKRLEGRGGWWNSDECSIDSLRQMLREHIEKGDMVDVMNFAAMIYARECAESIVE